MKTCKNFTEATTSKCLAIDRVKPEGAKPISDAELNLYKMRDAQISTRLVQVKRKKAVDRVKHMLALKRFVDFIAENKIGGGRFDYEELIEAENEYPLKVGRLGWRNWMWEYLLDADVWNEFLTQNAGECATYSVAQLLALSSTEYELLVNVLNQKEDQK